MISNQQVWIKDQKEKLKLAREIPYLSLCLIPMVQQKQIISKITFNQSYEIKSPPWTILWFRILGIFSVRNIKRLCVFMFQTWDNSQLLRRVLWINAEQAIGASLKHKNTQPLYMFNRVRVLHLNRLKERTWLHSFGFPSERAIQFV